MSMAFSGEGAFRALWLFDREAYAAHLKRLSPEDRALRFRHAAADAALEAHVARALGGGAHVIGWFTGGALRGAAEVALTPDGEAAEGGFEVEAPWRGRGVGSALVARAALWARNRGARRLVIHTARRNVAMLRAARRAGAAFEFDLTEATGELAGRPDLESHLREALLEQEGFGRWARDLLRPAPRGGAA